MVRSSRRTGGGSVYVRRHVQRNWARSLLRMESRRWRSSAGNLVVAVVRWAFRLRKCLDFSYCEFKRLHNNRCTLKNDPRIQRQTVVALARWPKSSASWRMVRRGWSKIDSNKAMIRSRLYVGRATVRSRLLIVQPTDLRWWVNSVVNFSQETQSRMPAAALGNPRSKYRANTLEAIVWGRCSATSAYKLSSTWWS